MYIRKSIGVRELSAEISKIANRRISGLTKDKDVMRKLLYSYGAIVTQFVPRSADETVPHHLNQWQISDNRLVWTRTNKSGNDIADFLYSGGRGQFHARPEIVQNHNPVPEWTDMVAPGTPEWNQFVAEASVIVKEWIDKNGQK